MAMPSENRSAPEMLADLVSEVTVLFRQEVQLARTEMSEKVDQALMSLAFLVVGAVLLLAALVILLQAAAAGLVAWGMQPHWAALLTAAVTAVIGFILLRYGLARLTLARLSPSRTVDQFQRDASVAKEQTR